MGLKVKVFSALSLTAGGTIIAVNLWSGETDIPELSKASSIEEKEELSPEEQKARIRAKAHKAFAKMNDYSFKLFSPCGIGTGWVLDYLIPEKGGYPTTWYIATNAHVVEKYRFKDNDYGQELPVNDVDTARLRYTWKPNTPRGVQLEDKTLWKHNACQFSDWYGFFDMNLAKQSNGEEIDGDKGAIATRKMKEPKLFYVAIDFLEADPEMDVTEKNYKDFAVLEIEFTDPNYAKLVTDNFAEKYPIESTEAINVFDQPLLEKHSEAGVSKLDKNFYSLAYPVQEGKKFDYEISWNEEEAEGSKLSLDPYGIYHYSGEQKLNGHVNSHRMGTTTWNGIERKNVGHYYFVKGFPMKGGSSGGLYIDEDGNVLGIKSRVEDGTWNSIHSFIEPLRSNRIVTSAFKTPAYDLIMGGAKGQKSSYKEQVIKYKKDTFLSRRGWKHKS